MTEERKAKLQRVLNQRQGNITVVMENVEDPHNISAVLRTCESVGIQDIYVLTTKVPQHKKLGKVLGFRSSSSAIKWLTIHEFSNMEKCVQTLRKKYGKIYTAALTHTTEDLYTLDLTQSIALVFGNERYGVTREMQALSDGNFIIPQVGIIQSLNISVACAVCIYEAFRQKRLVGHYAAPALPEAQITALKKEWGYEEE